MKDSDIAVALAIARKYAARDPVGQALRLIRLRAKEAERRSDEMRQQRAMTRLTNGDAAECLSSDAAIGFVESWRASAEMARYEITANGPAALQRLAMTE